MDSSLVEYVNGIEVIKTFSQTGKSFQKFSDAVKNYHDTTLDWWKNTWLYSALGLTVIPATLVGGIPVGAYLLMQGSISFSIYITCLILSLGIAGPLIQATYYADNFAVVDASIRQVGNFLDGQELVRPSKEVLLTDDGFHFEHVSFGYDKKEVLHDITFSPVQEGKTAIVGPSGSGKSTITKLMAGFWDVTSGHIIYGGQDIRNIPTSQLMKHISFVSQDNFLFNISIKENIRMGNPCATDEEVLAAAKAARCDEFISKMEYGYDTLVGDAGGKLSGGERQRITILLLFNWRIGLITLAGLGIGILLLRVVQENAKKVMPVRFQAQEEMTEKTLEFIQGNMVMRLFGTGRDGLNRVKEAFHKKQEADIRLENTAVWPISFYRYIFRLASCGVVLIAALLYVRQEMAFPICVMFLFAAFLVYSQMDGLASNIALLRIVDTALSQVESVLEIPEMSGNDTIDRIQNYNIKLHNISFGYENRPIIQNVTLKIPEHRVTAIVGPSGSGKTTLCNLITRFWDVQQGEIMIGGKNIKEIEFEELMKLMSIVFQKVYLFHDTIENNIKFGKPTATHEEVVEAARRACCHEFIEKLPNGYQTIIGEGGSTLSGGEKQRISIARAILKDAPIIILDEATSSVDPENQHALLTAINELTCGKTLIIIAHRLSTIKDADQIIVLDNGHVVQQGTHETLLQQDGIYRRFVKMRQTASSWKL